MLRAAPFKMMLRTERKGTPIIRFHGLANNVRTVDRTGIANMRDMDRLHKTARDDTGQIGNVP
ncbi:MAG TPA: hypothetical protein DCF73_03525 [Rhodobiaceae bacterium]|nr:hypothetical protein [Rhodobiaceae bacterium]